MSIFQRFREDVSGSVTPMFLLSAIPFLAVAGLAVDYRRATNTDSELQQIADSAALAAAAAPSGTGVETRRAIALDYIAANENIVRSAKIDKRSVTIGPNTIDVDLASTVRGTIMKVLKKGGSGEATEGGIRGEGDGAPTFTPDIEVSAHSEVSYGRDSYLCLLSLNAREFEAVRFYGNSDFMAEVCTVHANSDNLTAMRTMGSAYAEAEDFCAVGGWSGSGFQPDPTGGCNVKRDPYKDMPRPPVGACMASNPSPIKDKTITLSPGTYCGGLVIQGHSVVTLNPGVYVIKDGEFRVRVHSSLEGEDVVIYLVGDSRLEIESGASIDLKAPTTGTWASMVIMQDYDSKPGVTNVITSGGDVNITGAYYTPAQNLQVWANGDMNSHSPYFPIVVDTFEMSGNATLHVKLDWEAAGYPKPEPLKRPAYVLLSQ